MKQHHARGLTLLEMLLSLAMLSVVMTTAFGWSTLTARVGVTLLEPAKAEVEGSSVLRLIADDLLCRDLGDARGRGPAVELQGGDLIIRTRNSINPDSSGVVEHRYRRAAYRSILEVEERVAGQGVDVRVLLLHVKRFDVEIDRESGVLDVTIENGGQQMQQRYELP